MMPGSMGPGMMPGSMGPGMMPGQDNRVSIQLEEMPNQRTLDARPFNPVPTPWAGRPPPLLPGQATGIGINNLNPMQQQSVGAGAIARLPNAYRMYGYGPREVFWSTPVPVPEQNTGIMINAEYPLQKWMEDREVAHWDNLIRNTGWTKQGPWVQPFNPMTDVPDWKHKYFGQYEQAADLKQPRHHKDYQEEYYKKLNKQRDSKGLFEMDESANRRMTVEI